LREGESILEAGAVGHNHPWFWRDAIETGLEHRAWDLAAYHADALAAFSREEPLPWSDFVIGRGDNRPELAQELQRLRWEG